MYIARLRLLYNSSNEDSKNVLVTEEIEYTNAEDASIKLKIGNNSASKNSQSVSVILMKPTNEAPSSVLTSSV